MDQTLSVEAKPYAFTFTPRKTALVVIDMQRDFLLPDGFGACQVDDMTDVQASVAPVKELLILCRSLGLAIFHTREGHDPDLADCPSSKLYRNNPCRAPDALRIGDKGPMGRLLIRGQYGHDITDELRPLPGEIIIDKPGKGAFWSTPLMDELRARGITHLFVCGVTTECCFTTTIREANDRGFECCGVEEATAGYVSDFKASSLDMINFAGGLFGFTASLAAFRHLAPAPGKKLALVNGDTNGHSAPNRNPSDIHAKFPTVKWNGDLALTSLKHFYTSGGSIAAVVDQLFDRLEEYNKIDSAVWIARETRQSVLSVARALEEQYPDPSTRPPLYGVPFSVKDSLDVAHIQTTTACPPLAYTPTVTSTVCQLALDAGALYIGKTNLDQFATGLSGCRSPYGVPHSTFSPTFISGGSSSGSAVAVGAQLSSFSIATDTAGSGRVPSGFNGVVGYKPTRGTVSTVGLVPACPSLDCIALMAASVEDVRAVYNIVKSYDIRDPYAKWAVSRPRAVHSIGPQSIRFRFGIPPQEVISKCCPVYQRKFIEACEILSKIGGEAVKDMNWEPFQQAGDLLYDGTFVSERLATLPDNWVEDNKANLHPVVHKLFADVETRQSTAVQAYRDLMKKVKLTREAEVVYRRGRGGIDVLLVPTAPIHWTIKEIGEDPIRRNAFLGTFTHFGNILDLCAVAAPAGQYAVSDLGERAPAGSGHAMLPFGVTFLGMSGTDGEVLEIARRFGDAIASN